MTRSACNSTKIIGLGAMLGLRPLDRLQINNAHELRELRSWQRAGNAQDCDLPYFYFQRVTEDGGLEVSSPGGYIATVPPTDICDIIPCEPIIVRAMPRSVFLARQKLSVRDRQQPPGPDSYADAYVMRVEKDRWGRIDRVFVSFLDPSLNESMSGSAPIHPDDRHAIAPKARRTRMPVISKGNAANWSANHGVEGKQRLHCALAKALIRCAKLRDHAGVQTLSVAGLRPLKQADLNRLGYKIR